MTDNKIKASKLSLETLGAGGLELERVSKGTNAVKLLVRGRPAKVERVDSLAGGGEVFTLEIEVNGYLLGECLKLLGAIADD